jgi:hypothetical protein
MSNVISDTGFWVENDDREHMFIKELSKEIIAYISKHKIRSVYDLGCGEGDYLKAIVDFDSSISATGFEGHQISKKFSNVLKRDLSKSLDMPAVDLVISIEVGEHIPREFESTFLNNVCDSSTGHIILSWAVENQSGLGHVNCRNNDYIISQVEGRGWTFDEKTTLAMREVMPRIWIKNTLMVFTK